MNTTWDAEKDVVPYCIKNKMTVVAYTPIERGRVSMSSAVREIGKNRGKTGIQVALNYLIAQENVIPIPKTGSINHMKEIVGSWGWSLNKNEIDLIRGSLT